MTSKTGWPDNQRRPPPHGRVLASGTGVTNPSVGPFNVGAYQALAIYCSKAATVSIVWTAIGSTVQTTRTVVFDGVTLYQVIANQGQHVVSIDLTASNFTYSITESNLPLPPNPAAAALASGLGAFMETGTPLAIVSNTPTTVAGWGSAHSDDSSIFSTNLTTGVITGHVAGIYLVEAVSVWASFAGDRYTEIASSIFGAGMQVQPSRVRGAATPDDDIQVAAHTVRQGSAADVTFSQTVYQNTGANKNLIMASSGIYVTLFTQFF